MSTVVRWEMGSGLAAAAGEHLVADTGGNIDTLTKKLIRVTDISKDTSLKVFNIRNGNSTYFVLTCSVKSLQLSALGFEPMNF